MRRKIDTSERNIKSVIEARLGLQSTQRTIDQYNLPVKIYNFNYFRSPEFAEVFKQWDEKKQSKFLTDLGGFYAGVLKEKFIQL